MCLFVLSAATISAEAEVITHDFNAMNGTTLQLTNSNLTGTTDLLTYTCSGSAIFTLDHMNPIGKKKICIYMPNSSSVFTTTAVEGLMQIHLSPYPPSKCENIKVYVSTDGTNWGDAISGDAIEYQNNGGIWANVPRGTYYIKVTNTTSDQVSIISIAYNISPCYCLQVVSE